MNPLNYSHVFFLGIGGIGMSALARYFAHYNFKVSGYDKTRTTLCAELENEGIQIHYEENEFQIRSLIEKTGAENILVVYTPAVPKEHIAFEIFASHNIKLFKRAEILGGISKQFKTLAVSGTHGKTTTSTLLFHILNVAKKNVIGFLGGISNNYSGNLVFGNPESEGPSLMVVEADEYDRSFLQLFPYAAIVTSTDADHLDIYKDQSEILKSFELFCNQVDPDGILLVKKNVDNTLSLNKERLNYAVNLEADFVAQNIEVRETEFYFDLVCKGETISNLHLGIPGVHNIENAVAACGLAKKLGVSNEEIRQALRSFKGVKRRFEFRIKSEKIVYIDDYAHHPEELKATITAARDLFPNKKITGVFQPHLFSRTKDFADEFAQSLDLLDEVILLEIYPAREKPITGITSEMLIEKMKCSKKRVSDKKELVENLIKWNPEVIISMGAGDIDLLVPEIELALLQK